ncbi:MAG: DUF4350 domain-containing protein [Thermoleophilaceae bacterium]
MSPASRRRWIRRGVVAFVLVVAVNVLIATLGGLVTRPGGPPSSTYATAPEGLAAYADLLARNGHDVSRVRARADRAPLGRDATVVVLDPDSVSAPEGRALRRFVSEGGRLVAGGTYPERWLRRVVPRAPRWERRGVARAQVLAPVPESAGVGVARGAGRGAFGAGGDALPVLGRPGRAVMAVAAVGRGRVVLMADASPLQNRHLARADNAALGLALAGGRNRPVAFLESAHGFGEATGIEAIPLSWRLAIGGLALAGLLFMVARGRRLGPAEERVRALPPPRSAYVSAIAGAIARTKRRDEGVAPVRAAARSSLERRTGVPRDASEERLRRAAERVGLSEPELRAMRGRVGTDEEVMAVGRALARLNGAGR